MWERTESYSALGFLAGKPEDLCLHVVLKLAWSDGGGFSPQTAAESCRLFFAAHVSRHTQSCPKSCPELPGEEWQGEDRNGFRGALPQQAYGSNPEAGCIHVGVLSPSL